jgi:protein ImuB
LAHRPAQLLDRPEAIRVMSLVPDGPPMWLDWRGQSGEVVAASGPERIAFPWWTPQLRTTRDYFEAEDEFGRRLWIYRDAQSNQWFVHGQWT